MDIPFIFDIARGSFEDGPGIRTIVFLKGCPLKCTWCHNPESHSFQNEISWSAARCKACNQCINTCPTNAILDIKSHTIDHSKCIVCGICVDNCDFNAIKIIGKKYSPDELVEILLRDREYYETSGGGVTFSGGEPLMHIQYLKKVCSLLKQHNINIAIQTSGYFNYDEYDYNLNEFIDLIYFDIKIIDQQKHQQFTGKHNNIILKNLNNLLSEKNQKIIVRTPLIPEITDTKDNLTDIKSYIKELNIDGYELLEYNSSTGKERK